MARFVRQANYRNHQRRTIFVADSLGPWLAFS